ncbi:MAG: hypothetical protein ACK5B9_03130 [Flavobacteriia bacterium]|jgi:hypothetical protein
MDFKLLLFLAFGCIQRLCSQSDSSQFIYYNSNNIVYPKTLEYRKPELRDPYLFVDSAKVKMDGIQFFKSNDGFFAKYEDDFVKANVKGKINFYSYTSNSSNLLIRYLVLSNANSYNSLPFLKNAAESAKYIFPGALYNKGFDELAKANFKNLSVSLADNQSSMKMLHKYRKSVIREMVFYPLGAILCSTATYIAFHQDVTNENGFPVFLTANIGFGFLVAGAINTITKRKKIVKAIRIYNT